MRKLILLLLTLAMILGCTVSCGEQDSAGNADNAGGSDNGGSGGDDIGGSGDGSDSESGSGGENNDNEGDTEVDNYVAQATVLAVKGGASGIVVLQHDDAYQETAVVMDKLLAKYGLVADVAMLSNRVYNYSTGKAKEDVVSFWQEILDTGRWKITSHSATHTWWGTATDNGDGTYTVTDNVKKMTDEIVGSGEILRELFPGQRVLTFAYPGFSTEKNKYTDGTEASLLKYIYSQAARELIGETYIAGRRVQADYSVTDTTIDWTMSGCYHIGGNYTTSKPQTAAQNGTLMILYVHNMVEVPEDDLKTYTYPSNTMAAYYFEDTCKKVRALVDSGEIWNTHYEDAVMYLREAQSASVSISGNKSGVKVTLTDEMDDEIYNFPLTVRISADESWKAVKITQGDKVSYAKVEYEAYEFYGGEYYALCEIVPDGGEAVIVPVDLSEVPEVKPEEPKPTPTLPEAEKPAEYLSFEEMPSGNIGKAKFTVNGIAMRNSVQDNATVEASVVADGTNKYIIIDKTAIASTSSSQNWLNIIRDGKGDSRDGYILFEARVKINVVTNASGLYFRAYNGRDAEKDGGTYPFNYAFKSSGGMLQYNNHSLGVKNGEWFTMRVTMTADNVFTMFIKNESGKTITDNDVSYADGEFIPRFSEVGDGISTVDGLVFMSSSSFIGSFALDYVIFEYVKSNDTGTEPGGEDTHEHNFVGGKCECGANEPTPNEKPEKPTDARYYSYVDFNAGTAGFTDASNVSVVETVIPAGRDNAALHISKASTADTDRFYFESGGKVTDAKEITISFSMKLNAEYHGCILQTLLTDSTSTTPYNLAIRTSSSGFYFTELPSGTQLGGTYSYNDWHTVELKLTFGDDGSFLATLTVDGAVAATSATFASASTTDRAKPSGAASRIGFYGQKTSTFDLYLDDVMICIK